MSYRTYVGVPLALTLLAGGVWAASTLKSGPQVGSSAITPFEPLNVTGSDAGKKKCLV